MRTLTLHTDSSLAQGYYASDIKRSGVLMLSKVSAEEVGGFTTVRFTRTLASGRYPLDPSQPSYINVARGSSDGVSIHDATSSLTVNLRTGIAKTLPSRTQRVWIAHGVLMLLAWLLLMPNGILFATCASDLLDSHARFQC